MNHTKQQELPDFWEYEHPDRTLLKWDIRAITLKRMEDAARSVPDFEEVVKQWDHLDDKLAGYAIVSNNSEKHNGESQRLRYVLYEAANYVSGNDYLKSVNRYMNNLYARWHKSEKALAYKEKWLNAMNEQNKNITHRNA